MPLINTMQYTLLHIFVVSTVEYFHYVTIYVPGSERIEKQVEYLWKKLNECLMSFAAGDREVVMEDMNARLAD